MPYLDLFPCSELYYGLIGKGWKRLTIVPSISEASVTFVATTKVAMGNSVWVPSGTSVTYTVSATGYDTETDTVVVTQDVTISVELEVSMFTLTINPVPANATVILTAPDYEQEGNSITVPYSSMVDYTVSATGYVSKSDSALVLEDKTLTVPLISNSTLRAISTASGSNSSISSSTGGGAWSTPSTPTWISSSTFSCSDGVYNGTKCVLIGQKDSSGGAIVSSSDFSTWATDYTSTSELTAMEYGSPTHGFSGYVAVGNNKTIVVSTGLTSWEKVIISSVNTLNFIGVAIVSESWFGLDEEGNIWDLRSSTWSPTNPTTPSKEGTFSNARFLTFARKDLSLYPVLGGYYNGSGFVIFMDHGYSTTVSVSLNSVVSNDGLLFVGAGDDGYMAYLNPNSSDTWSTVRVGTNKWNKVIFDKTRYIAVGDGGYITTSTDGMSWTNPVQSGTVNWKTLLVT